MNSLDMQMRFLEGKPIKLHSDLVIYKVSLSNVDDIGYTKYNRIINMLCLDEEQINSKIDSDFIDVYTFLILNAYQSEIDRQEDTESTFMDDLLEVLGYIFHNTISFSNDGKSIIIGNISVLHQDNFKDFQSVIKKRNCLENIEEDKDNPANEMARQLLEKRKKAREKLAKAKAQQNGDDCEPLTINDLISIFAEAEHMKLEDVFQYDIYQFNDQFNRMKIFRDYKVNIQALLAGAKSDDVELQHWLSKIKLNK